MAEQRKPIPPPIQQEVRQRCGFGCVICGAPLYEYHHIIPYSESRQHIASEITLLCDLHHKEATNGLLTPEKVSKANLNPHNVSRGISSPYNLHFSGKDHQINIGGNIFKGSYSFSGYPLAMIPISVDDIDLIAFGFDKEGNLFLHANLLFDEYNRLILAISENTLVYRTALWDIRFVGKKLSIREEKRKIFFEIEFQPPSVVNITRARLLCNGVEIIVRQNHIFFVNSKQILKGCTAIGILIGIQIGRNERDLPSGIGTNPEDFSRYFLSRKEVQQREKEMLERIKSI